MQTVDKAFELLGHFSERRAEVGLSDLARLSGFDKATTRRLLVALGKHGLVEQNPADKRYRLGPGILRLARIREASIPLVSMGAPLLRRLADQTGETAHLTALSGQRLATIAVEESHRSNRIRMDAGEMLPLHATASGILMLAFADSSISDAERQKNRKAFTSKTLTGDDELEAQIIRARENGFVVNTGWFEPDACSIAAPWFDQYGKARGSIAVAAPSTRFSDPEQDRIRNEVLHAAAKLTSDMGGTTPTGMAA